MSINIEEMKGHTLVTLCTKWLKTTSCGITRSLITSHLDAGKYDTSKTCFLIVYGGVRHTNMHKNDLESCKYRLEVFLENNKKNRIHYFLFWHFSLFSVHLKGGVNWEEEKFSIKKYLCSASREWKHGNRELHGTEQGSRDDLGNRKYIEFFKYPLPFVIVDLLWLLFA